LLIDERTTPAGAGSGLGTATVQVERKELVADGVVAVTLTRPDGGRLPDWAPGAHIDVVLPDGTVRQYSLCGDRWDPYRYRIGVLREPGGRGGSRYLHDELRPGDRLGFAGPRNNFAMVPAPGYLFVAGGIGITPLLPMVHQAELVGADWTLVYGGRSLSSMAFLDSTWPGSATPTGPTTRPTGWTRGRRRSWASWTRSGSTGPTSSGTASVARSRCGWRPRRRSGSGGWS
jgi:NAD(P)H-flavin reductase